jgi:hypothetical protein
LRLQPGSPGIFYAQKKFFALRPLQQSETPGGENKQSQTTSNGRRGKMVGPTRFELVTFCTPSAGEARDAECSGRRKPVLQGFGRNAAPTAKAEILKVSYTMS